MLIEKIIGKEGDVVVSTKTCAVVKVVVAKAIQAVEGNLAVKEVHVEVKINKLGVQHLSKAD